MLKVPAQKPAGPSRVPPDCVLGISPQSPVGSLLAPSGVPDQNSLGQSPEPQGAPVFPFQPRIDTWVEGLMACGLERDVALLATQSNKPSSQRQFQSGWKQLGKYLASKHLRHEDITVATVANFLGRQLSIRAWRPVWL